MLSSGARYGRAVGELGVVGLLGSDGPPGALLGREHAFWIHLALEALGEGAAGRGRIRLRVVGRRQTQAADASIQWREWGGLSCPSHSSPPPQP